jgi:hypothetical protein
MSEISIIEGARQFIYENGRLIDRKLYEFWFEGGSKEAVWEALRAYQNTDGGFGNALEPDIRCPQSQTVPTEVALYIMEEIGFEQQMVKGIAGYLSKLVLEPGGFPLIGLDAMNYPHAPWWKVEQDHIPSMNPTGRIIGLLLKQDVYTDFQQEEWFKKTVDFVWKSIEESTPTGYHDGIQYLTFLLHTPDRDRAEPHLRKLDKWLTSPGVIERDPNAEGYVHKILDWAETPGSYITKLIPSHETAAHLDTCLLEQQEDGGWPISFPGTTPLAALEWRGWLTVNRLKTLQAYNRLKDAPSLAK